MYFISSFEKKAFIFFYLLFLSAIAPAQNTTHPTINSLEVSYKDSDFIGIDSLRLVRSQSVITLKSDTNVTILHLKIINQADSSIIYQADYSFTTSPVLNTDGLLLFKKDASVCHINSAIEIPLNLYLYQVTTENSLGEISEVYYDFK